MTPPLARSITDTLLLKLRMPSLERYDDNGDPDDHIQPFKMTMRLNSAIEPLLRMAFPITIRKSVRDWFNSLAARSIHMFKELSNAFCS